MEVLYSGKQPIPIDRSYRQGLTRMLQHPSSSAKTESMEIPFTTPFSSSCVSCVKDSFRSFKAKTFMLLSDMSK